MRAPRRWILIPSGVAVSFLLGSLLLGSGEAVVVRDAESGEVFHVPLPKSGRFGLEYLHSYYRAPAVEQFVAEGTRGFRLAGISSTSEEVLDYYGLEGEREVREGWFELRLEESRSYERLPLIATETGRRTLVVSGERTPLYTEEGPRHLIVSVEKTGPLDKLPDLGN